MIHEPCQIPLNSFDILLEQRISCRFGHYGQASFSPLGRTQRNRRLIAASTHRVGCFQIAATGKRRKHVA